MKRDRDKKKSKGERERISWHIAILNISYMERTKKGSFHKIHNTQWTMRDERRFYFLFPCLLFSPLGIFLFCPHFIFYSHSLTSSLLLRYRFYLFYRVYWNIRCIVNSIIMCVNIGFEISQMMVTKLKPADKKKYRQRKKKNNIVGIVRYRKRYRYNASI